MRRTIIVLVSLALVLAGGVMLWPIQGRATGGGYTANLQVYFSPHGGCTDAIVQHINGARKTILMQAYSFTSTPIAKALVDAHKRGVNVRAILDKSQRTEKYSGATFLYNAGIPVVIDDKYAIAHNKIMVIDGHTIITGSFNFTSAAENNNAENLLILQNDELAARYTQNWQYHLSRSVPYAGHTSVVPSTRTRQKHSSSTALPTMPTATAVYYIGNVKSHAFHLPTCSSLPSKENQIIFHSRAEAIAAGYRPCKRCNP